MGIELYLFKCVTIQKTVLAIVFFMATIKTESSGLETSISSKTEGGNNGDPNIIKKNPTDSLPSFEQNLKTHGYFRGQKGTEEENTEEENTKQPLSSFGRGPALKSYFKKQRIVIDPSNNTPFSLSGDSATEKLQNKEEQASQASTPARVVCKSFIFFYSDLECVECYFITLKKEEKGKNSVEKKLDGTYLVVKFFVKNDKHSLLEELLKTKINCKDIENEKLTLNKQPEYVGKYNNKTTLSNIKFIYKPQGCFVCTIKHTISLYYKVSDSVNNKKEITERIEKQVIENIENNKSEAMIFLHTK